MEFDLIENEKFLIVQITHALPSSWKEILRNYTESINSLAIQDHHLIKKHQTLDTNLRMFQYKLLNNVLYLNNMLFRFRKVDSPLCSYCNEEEETPLHLFHSCFKTKQLWNKLKQYFSQFINIPHSSPQSSIVGIFENNQHSMLINHLLLIFKFYIYSARNTKQLNFDNLKNIVKKTKELEKQVTSSNKLKLLKKWRPINHIID